MSLVHGVIFALARLDRRSTLVTSKGRRPCRPSTVPEQRVCEEQAVGRRR